MLIMYSTYHKYTDKNSHYIHKVFTKVYLMSDFYNQLKKSKVYAKKICQTVELKSQLSQTIGCLIMQKRLYWDIKMTQRVTKSIKLSWNAISGIKIAVGHRTMFDKKCYMSGTHVSKPDILWCTLSLSIMWKIL